MKNLRKIFDMISKSDELNCCKIQSKIWFAGWKRFCSKNNLANLQKQKRKKCVYSFRKRSIIDMLVGAKT